METLPKYWIKSRFIFHPWIINLTVEGLHKNTSEILAIGSPWVKSSHWLEKGEAMETSPTFWEKIIEILSISCNQPDSWQWIVYFIDHTNISLIYRRYYPIFPSTELSMRNFTSGASNIQDTNEISIIFHDISNLNPIPSLSKHGIGYHILSLILSHAISNQPNIV